jgi:hypothetical protein
VSHSSRRNRKHRGGQAADVTKNIEDAVTRMKTMSLAQLNLAVSAAFLKYMIAMTNIGSQEIVIPLLQTYFEQIPEYLKTKTPTEFAAFSNSIDPPFAILMFIIDKFAPPNNPQTMLQPTKIDSGVSQRLSSVFSTVKTITPAEVKIQADDALKFLMSPRPPEIQQIVNQRLQSELFAQITSEMHKELLKITPEQLVSYPVWPAIVKNTPYTSGEMNTVNHLMFIGYKTIFKPIFDELMNQGTSSSTTRPAATTTRPAATTTRAAATTTRPQIGRAHV